MKVHRKMIGTWLCITFHFCSFFVWNVLQIHITSHLPIILSEILSNSEIIKNARNCLVFGENNSCYLSNFSRTHGFWNFDHISRIRNWINYISFSLAKVIIIRTTQMFIFDVSLKKDTHRNTTEHGSYEWRWKIFF